MPDSYSTLCMYTPTAYGGHALYTYELLSALARIGQKSGLEVALITSSDLSPDYRTPLYPIYDVMPPLLPLAAFRTPLQWSLYRQAHYFRREKIFLKWVRQTPLCRGIHFQEYTPWLAPYHFPLLKRWGKYLFNTVHSIYPHKYLPGVPKVLFDHWNRTAWRQCDALFVHTDGLRNSLSHFLRSGHPPIFVTPHGVSSSPAFSPQRSIPEEQKQNQNLLFFGVIRPNKGLHVLLHAMKELPNCTLTIAGEFKEAGYKRQIQKLINPLPPDQIKIIDRFIKEDEIPNLFEKSSLAIFPYTSFFAQSGVLFLAIKYGLPVVVSDVGALGESVSQWGIGKVVSSNNASALANAIQELSIPKAYRDACDAIDQIRGNLSWSNTAERTYEAYLSIIK